MIGRLSRFFLVFVFSYFVLTMIILGNGSSFMGRYLAPFFIPVANIVGLNTTWNFFSPDPAHIMYLKYIIHFEDEYGNPTKESIENYYPERKFDGNFRLDIRRSSYVMRFLAMDSRRIEKYFVPWICKKNPQATRIQIEIELKRIPPLDVASTLKDFEYDELIKEEILNPNSYRCPNETN